MSVGCNGPKVKDRCSTQGTLAVVTGDAPEGSQDDMVGSPVSSILVLVR